MKQSSDILKEGFAIEEIGIEEPSRLFILGQNDFLPAFFGDVHQFAQ